MNNTELATEILNALGCCGTTEQNIHTVVSVLDANRTVGNRPNDRK